MLDLLKQGDVIGAIYPVDAADAAADGDWVNMATVDRLLVVVIAAAGTDNDDLVLSLRQATAADGTGAKALTFTKIYHKIGATGVWTEVEQAAAASYDSDALNCAQSLNIFAIDVRPEMLDGNNGFNFVQVRLAQTSSAKLVSALYVVSGRNYSRHLPATLLA